MLGQNQKIFIMLLLLASVVFFILPCIAIIVKYKILSEKRRKSEIGVVITFSGFLIIAIWCMRYAVGYFGVVTETITQNPTKTVEALECFFATLRTFSVDNGYAVYIYDLKNMLQQLFEGVKVNVDFVQHLLVAYASMLNLVAPVVGGAIIFELLASVFPKIRLFFTYGASWRTKYFFSELNEASIALANGIYETDKTYFKKPVLIFTDVYFDDGDEAKTELLLKAKSIGAICVKDDIAYVRKNSAGSRIFLLMDENESSNLQAITDLSDDYNSKYLKNAEVFFVSTSDAYVEIEQRIKDKLTNDLKFSEEEFPTFIPIKSYRNLISDLLVKIPLFEPLIDKEDKGSLSVTILGTGQIGREMFLTTYWMGQILNCELNINIVSNESEDSFWNEIDFINPEIRQTLQENDPILRVNKKGDISPVYSKINYICCDARSSDFVECLEENTPTNILATDYYFVALGADELNISVANKIKNAVGKYHISKNEGDKTIITYVVYDSVVSEILNRKNMFSYVGETSDILMCAIGSLEDVYSAKNFFFKEYDETVENIHTTYLYSQGKEERAKEHKKRMNDDYKYWASLARGMHIKYKAFSMGILYDSVFNFKSTDDEEYKKSVDDAIDKYKNIARGVIEFNSTAEAENHKTLLHEMAWLEHRRWNAFTRVKGFRYTGDYASYATPGKIGSYKQMDIKLHPCLVECDKKGIRAEMDEKGNINADTLLKSTDEEAFDLLDDLSYDLYKKGYNDYDMKQYDYPFADF